MISPVSTTAAALPQAPAPTRAITTPPLPPLSLSQFATLHCGPQLPNSPLDAPTTSMRQAANYLATAVDALGSADQPTYAQLSAALREIVEESAYLQRETSKKKRKEPLNPALANRLATRLRALQANETLFVPMQLLAERTGGVLLPRDVILQFSPKQDGTFTVAVFAGAGVGDWPGAVGTTDGTKVRTANPSCWHGVPAELVLGSSDTNDTETPLWLRALFELHASPGYEVSELFGMLMARAEDAGAKLQPPTQSTSVTPPQPDNTPWKPLMALARSYLGEAEYKVFKARLQVSTLRATAPKLPANATGELLLQDSITNLKSSLNKLHRRGLVDAAGVTALLSQVDAVAVPAPAAMGPLPPVEAAVLKASTLHSTPAVQVSLPPLEFKHNPRVPRATSAAPTAVPPAMPTPTTATELTANLQACLAFAKTGLAQGNATQVAGCVRTMVLNLPGPGDSSHANNLWNQLDPIDCEETLCELLAYFASACWQRPELADSTAHDEAVQLILFSIMVHQMNRALADYAPVSWPVYGSHRASYSSAGLPELLDAWRDALPDLPEGRDRSLRSWRTSADNGALMEAIMARHPEFTARATRGLPEPGAAATAVEALLEADLGKGHGIPPPLRAYGLCLRAEKLCVPSEWRIYKEGRGPLRVRYNRREDRFEWQGPRGQPPRSYGEQVLRFDAGDRSNLRHYSFESENTVLAEPKDTARANPPVQQAERYAVGIGHVLPRLKFDALISYYNQHLHALAEPQHRAQLWNELWESSVLVPELRDQPRLRQRLESMLHRALDLYTSTADVEATAFIASLLGQLRDHCNVRGIPHNFTDPRPALAQLDAGATKQEEHTCLSAAWWNNLPYHLDAEALPDAELLAAQRHAVHLMASEKNRVAEGIGPLALRLHETHQATLHRALHARMQDPAFAAQAMSQLETILDAWQVPEASGPWHGTYPTFCSGGLRYDMLAGTVTQGEHAVRRAPQDHVCQLLRTLGLVQGENPVVVQEGSTWVAAGGQVRARWVGSDWCVQMRMEIAGEAAWYERSDTAHKLGKGIPEAIRSGHTLWRRAEAGEPELVWTTADNQACYMSRRRGTRLQVMDIQSGARLAHVCAAPQVLRAFAEPKHMLVWYREDQGLRVEIPHRGVRLSVDADGTLRWPNDPRYRVDAHSLPIFKHHTDMMALSREDGARKLILPTDTLRPVKDPPPTLRHPLERAKASDGVPYVVVDVLEDGTLTHPDAAVNLHLAYLYAADGNSAQALHHLQRGRSLQPYGGQALAALQALRCLPFEDPETRALRAHAAAALANNLGVDIDSDKDFAANWRACVSTYLQVFNHVPPALRLQPYDEAQLLRAFGGTAQSRLHQRHQTLETLDRLRAPSTRRRTQASAPHAARQGEILSLLDHSVRTKRKLADAPLLASPMSTCFAEALHWAMGDAGPVRQAELRERLRYVPHGYAATVLRQVLDNPALHPAVRDVFAALPLRGYPDQRTPVATVLLTQLNIPASLPITMHTPPGTVWPPANPAAPWPQLPGLATVAFCDNGTAPVQPLGALAAQCTTDTARVISSTATLQALATLARQNNGDALLAEQVQDVTDNVRTYAAQPQHRAVLRDDVDFSALLTELQTQQAACQLQERTHVLEAFANSDALPAHARLEYRLATEGRVQSRITVAHMITCLLQNNLSALHTENPHLGPGDIDSIRKALIELLLARSLTQQVQRARDTVRALQISSDPEEADGLRKQLAATLAATRSYDPEQHPELLVFECAAELLLRSAQVQALQQLLQPQTGNLPACIFQLAMGVGKTKVLLPLLAQRLADGQRTAFVLVPQPLLTTARHDLQHTTQIATQQQCVRFDFDRNSDCSVLRLERLRAQLDDVCVQRQVVITSRASMAAFKLQYEDFLVQLGTPDLTPDLRSLRQQQVQIMGDMLSTWRKQGVAILDEADQALDVRSEVNFSSGKPHSLPESHLDVVMALYQALSLHPDVDLHGNAQSHLRAATYARIKPLLAAQVLNTLPTLAAFSAAERAALVPYVSQDKTDAPAFLRAAYDGSADQRLAAQAVALLREELLHLLPLTLRRNGGEHYGLSRQADAAPYAIPYSRSEPQEGSQFGNEYETLNYTLQLYMHAGQGLTPNALLQTLRTLCDQASEDMAQFGEAMEATPAARAFATLAAGSGLTLRDVYQVRGAQHPHVHTLWNHLQTHSTQLLHYVRTYVLPAVQVYDAQLTSDAYDLVDTFAQVQGFTGTPYNHRAYPPQLHTVTQAQSDGLVSEVLFNPAKTQVHVSHAREPRELLDGLHAEGRTAQLHAIIDAGALWRGLSNAQVASNLAAWFAGHPQLGIRGVLFFTADGGLALQKLDGSTMHLGRSDAASLARAGLAPHELFAFYDQAHATGADLPLPATACGAVTLGELTCMRDLQQGALRLRQLAEQQRCVVVVPRPLADKLAGSATPTMPQLFAHTLHNQARRLASDKLRAVRQDLRAQVRRLAMDSTYGRPVRERAAVMAALRPILLTPRQEDPYVAFADTQEIPLSTSVARSLAHIRQQVRTAERQLQASYPTHAHALMGLAQRWDDPQTVQRLLAPRGAMPPTERRAPAGQETENMVQREVEREVAREVEVQQAQSTRARVSGAWPGPMHLRALDSVVPGVFDAGLLVSNNYLRTLDQEAISLGGAYQKPVNYIFAMRTPAGVNYGAISAYEANALRTANTTALEVANVPADFAVLDQDGDVLQTNGAWQPVPHDAAFSRAMMQLKVLSRGATQELRLSRTEAALLQTWLQQGTPEQRARKRELAYGQGPA